MNNDNPLLKKYEELYGHKEESKKVEFELNSEFLEELKNKSTSTDIKVISPTNVNVSAVATSNTGITATSNTGITKATRTIKSYDKQSTNDAFLQIAEKVKNGSAQVACVSIELDSYGNFGYGKKIIFEVYDYGS
jgi:hypothetical protein